MNFILGIKGVVVSVVTIRRVFALPLLPALFVRCIFYLCATFFALLQKKGRGSLS